MPALAWAARETLTGDREYFLSLSGNDSNSGTSAGQAWRNPQVAADRIALLDFYGYTVKLKFANGVWSQSPIVLRAPWVGASGDDNYSFIIEGNPGSMDDVFFDTPAQPFVLRNGATALIDGMKLKATTGHGLHVVDNAKAMIQNINFAGAGPQGMLITANQGANVSIGPAGGLRITGSSGCRAFINPNRDATITIRQTNIHIENTPNFSEGFVFAEMNGTALVDLLTFSGSGATGKRYSLWSSSVCNTNVYPGTTPNPSYLPGSLAGFADSTSTYC